MRVRHRLIVSTILTVLLLFALAALFWPATRLTYSQYIALDCSLVAGIGLALVVGIVSYRRRNLHSFVVGVVVLSLVIGPLQQIGSAVQAHGRTDVWEATTVNEDPARSDIALSPGATTDAVTDCADMGPGVVATDDYDHDGIEIDGGSKIIMDNLTENCLGTSFTGTGAWDTDSDSITDTVELQGFDLNGTLWTTNPLLRDSNLDGMDDVAEWNPQWSATDPDTLDFDGDGTPNIWDDDNDNDGVKDDLDNSPYKVLDYQTAYTLKINKPSGDLHSDTYVYVDLLLQPQNESHLRYNTTPLDWPHDSKAQIQDLDNSKDDIKLFPMLSFSVETWSSAQKVYDLSSHYGMVINGSGPYQVLAPLVGFGANGSVDAFKARLAFTPELSAAGLSLQDLKIEWLVQAKTDSQKGNTIVSTEELIVSYIEPKIRIAGLSVTESKGVEVGLYGVPQRDVDQSDEATDIYQFVGGMQCSYLHYIDPNLSEIGKSPYTWGVDNTIVINYATYPHEDEALASTTMTETQQFLDQHYLGQSGVNAEPMLAIGYQETSGALGLEQTTNSASDSTLNFNLSNNTLSTMRQVQVAMYEHDTEGWQSLSMNDAQAVLDKRYSALSQKDAADYLIQTYYGGLVGYVEVDGSSIVAQGPPPDGVCTTQVSNSQATTLPDYLSETYQLDDLDSLTASKGNSSGWYAWEDALIASSGTELESVLNQAQQLQVRVPSGSTIPDGFYWGLRVPSESLQNTIESGQAAAAQDVQASATVQANRAVQQATALWLAGDQATWIVSIATIDDPGVLWTQYHATSKNIQDIQSDLNLASSVSANIHAVVTENIFDQLSDDEDAFSHITSGSDFANDLVNFFEDIGTLIADLFVSKTMLSELADNNPVVAGDLAANPAVKGLGTVTGNTITLGADFTSTIVPGPGEHHWNWTHSRSGNMDDVRKSSAYARWVYGGATASVGHDTPGTSGKVCTSNDSTKQGKCTDRALISVTPDEAVRNLGISVITFLDTKLREQTCSGVGIYDYCTDSTVSNSIPSTSDHDAVSEATSTFYVDILPDDIGGLWDWSQINNLDKDGDGLLDSEETDKYGTSTDNWDSDGDELSDYFEAHFANFSNCQGTSKSSLLNSDCDGDGLSDAQELLLGTAANNPDHDGDGLTDGEEACHRAGDGSQVGGWEVTSLGSDAGITYWVCSNPLLADADNDSLIDSTEKSIGTSPNAANTAPRLTQEVLAPLYQHDSQSITVLGPGDLLEERFSIINDIANPLAQNLEWCGPAGVFDVLTVTQLDSPSGYTLPTTDTTNDGSQDCTIWPLAQAPIATGERMTVTLQAPVLATAPSGTQQQTLTLWYTDPVEGDQTSSQDVANILVDTDEPTTAIIDPSDGLATNNSSYTVSGTAGDPTSWVVGLEIAVDGGDWQSMPVSNAWEWDWSLPAEDGNYALSTRATDVVSNVQSSPASVSIIVDRTAPGASFTNLSEGQVLTEITTDSLGNGTFNVEWSATDQLAGVEGSGVAVVEMSVDGRPWETIWTPRRDPEQTASSTHTWEFNAGTSGSHTLAVRGIDGLGQIGEAAAVTVILDLLPPTSSLANYSADLPADQTMTFQGHADDTGNVPLPARPVELSGTLNSLDDATVWLEASTVGDLAGATATWLGDIDGDGRADAAIGMPAANSGAGQVVILYGRAGDWPVPPDRESLTASPSTLVSITATGLGQYVAPAGDINGDGLDDLLIGDMDQNRIYLVYGRTRIFGSPWALDQITSAQGAILTTSQGTVGQWMAAAGDVNEDKHGDLLIGSTDQIYLVLGRSSFSPTPYDISTQAAAVLGFASSTGASFTGVGDVDGDALTDFIVSDPTNSYGAGAPYVYLFSGSKSYKTASLTPLDPLTDATATFSGDSPVGEQTIPLGDVNGDGLADIMYSSGDNPRLVFGRQGGGWGQDNSGDRTLSYNPPANGILAAPGDVNGDGYNDIVLGTSIDQAYLIHGGASLAGTPPVVATIDEASSIASAPYAAGSDLNCDLSSDLLVVPPNAGSGMTASGVTSPVSSLSVDGIAQTPVYISPTYTSSTCNEEGLVWGVDCFASIQSAIDSGAQAIRALPGVYQETITLADGVNIVGAGPEITILAPPSDGTSQPLVSAEMDGSARLAHMTLRGDDSYDGVRVIQGNVTLQRLIVRNTLTAATIDGSQSKATLINNTVVNNVDGVRTLNCGNLDQRNTILAFNKGVAIDLASCNIASSETAETVIRDHDLFWRNGQDLILDGSPADQPAPGDIFADPLFVDASINDFHIQAQSPAINAGDPEDPTLPATGGRVDIGVWQHAQAAFYADKGYCQTCDNDGLDWQVDAFDTIGQAVDAATATMQQIFGEALPGVYTVGVGPGTYTEDVLLPSYTRLAGSGADLTTLQGTGISSTVVISGATQTEVTGLTITGSGNDLGDAGIMVVGNSNHITVTRNLISGNTDGITFADGSTGVVINNTVVNNTGTAVKTVESGSWISVRDNIMASNSTGLCAVGDAVINNDYNLLFGNAHDYANTLTSACEIDSLARGTLAAVAASSLIQRPNEIVGQDPLFVNPSGQNYHLQIGSPAVNAGDSLAPVPVGGGDRIDLGYDELLATPITLLFGQEGQTCAEAVSGVASVELGISHVISATTPYTDTPPSNWMSATLSTPGETGSYWNVEINPDAGDGLYRLYEQAADEVGNSTGIEYIGAVIADGTPPQVTLTSPATNTTTSDVALILRAQVSDYVPTGEGQRFNVASMWFEVNGEVVNADWVIDGWSAASGQPRTFSATIPADVGTYDIVAVSRDRAGNEGRSTTSVVTVEDKGNIATIITPQRVDDTNVPQVKLSGYARFANPGENAKVTVTVKFQEPVVAELVDPTATVSAWTAEVTLQDEGEHQITASASSGTDDTGKSGEGKINIKYTTRPPLLTVLSPEDNAIVNSDLTISGTVSTQSNGLGALEVSTDGGFTWLELPTYSDFSLEWTVPEYQDYVSYPIMVRAIDWAGNTTLVTRRVFVDNLGPTAFTPVDLDPEPFNHIQTTTEVQAHWQPPVDGSGDAVMLFATSTATDTIPTDQVNTTHWTGQFPTAGTWYIHLMAVDGIGNQTQRSYGPYYVEEGQSTLTGQASMTGVWTQSILVDGLLDISHGEWNTEAERLDVDARGGEPHTLFTAWDSSNLFLGWQGALWGSRGTAWIYLDTKPGGTSQAIHADALTLPMTTDFAIEITSSTEGRLWRFDGDWLMLPDDSFEFAHGPSGDTEVSVPLTTVEGSQGLGLLAFAFQELTGEITAAFPTTNPLATCETAANCPDWQDVYAWPDLGQDIIPNASQPQGHHAQVILSSPQGFQSGWGPGDELQYVVTVQNLDNVELSASTLILDGSPGLRFDSLQRDQQISAQDDRWFVQLEPLSPGTSTTMTLSTHLQEDLTGIDGVTLTAELDMPLPASEPTLVYDSHSHQIDSIPPVVSIELPNAALPPGAQIVRGTASDVDGGGVSRVEVRIDDGPWIQTIGTVAWKAVIDVPAGGAFTLSARAIDVHGYLSPEVAQVVSVDDGSPVAMLDLQSKVHSGQTANLQGTATDYNGSGIAQVEIQIDDGRWTPISLPLTPLEGTEVAWRYSWTLPRDDGREHSLSVRAIDLAGNVGLATEPIVVIVDSIAPLSSISVPEPGSVVFPPELLVLGTADDVYGLASVEVSLDSGQTWIPAEFLHDLTLLDPTVTTVLPADSTIWILRTPIPQPESGELIIHSRATDFAGNVQAADTPVRVRVQASLQQIWMPLVYR